MTHCLWVLFLPSICFNLVLLCCPTALASASVSPPRSAAQLPRLPCNPGPDEKAPN
jgi:hypothetical protein